MNEAKELREAIAAADFALDSLCRARDSLNSARNWGIFDIVGGGLISTLIKRSKMSDASAEMEAAKRAICVNASKKLRSCFLWQWTKAPESWPVF